MEVTRVEQRAYIKIAVLRGINAMECHSELVEALGKNALPYRTVARWVGKFQEGRVSTSDEQRSGRPVLSFRQNPSPVTLIVIVAYYVRGVIVCHFVPHGRTVTAQYYRDFLVRQVRRGVRHERPDLVNSAIILHDNARPHKAECVGQLLRHWGWEELEHPPYSPDISPCDFNHIRTVKAILSCILP
jgi:hypothetical protein